jgi:hypothetical protein
MGGGTRNSNQTTPTHGRTVYGGAAGASVDATNGALAATTTIYGGAGGADGNAASGTDGTVPGGGGGPTNTGAQSGAGARGELRIWGVV